MGLQQPPSTTCFDPVIAITSRTLRDLCQKCLRVPQKRLRQRRLTIQMKPKYIGRKMETFSGNLNEDLDCRFKSPEKDRQSNHSLATYSRHLDGIPGVPQGDHRSHAVKREYDFLHDLVGGLQDLPDFERLQAEIGKDGLEC